MSFVGPRPALYNQDVVALRTEKGVHILTPGLTEHLRVFYDDIGENLQGLAA
jgi:lipopolysaccharide/colanic/teichoic acid biosynthesis glycosyltransferase